jgi:hypothetical protein
LLEGREKRFVRQPLVSSGLGNAEIYDLGDGHPVVVRDQNIRRFDVAMDNALLMRMP